MNITKVAFVTPLRRECTMTVFVHWPFAVHCYKERTNRARVASLPARAYAVSK